MSQPRRKNVYKANFAKEFNGIRKGKDDFHAFCTPCKDEINLALMGKAAISQHQQKPKHKENARVSFALNDLLLVYLFRALSNFLPSRSAPSANDDKTAATERAWAFHVATHNQAFSSTDCCSSDALFRTMFSDSEVTKKFGCGRDKTQAILKGVLAPYSVECLLKELGEQPFSISTDASNHKEIKLFPLVIRFFTAAKGVQVPLLDMRDLPEEYSQLVADFIAQILEKHGLKWENLVSFCADNAPVNFGGNTERNTERSRKHWSKSSMWIQRRPSGRRCSRTTTPFRISIDSSAQFSPSSSPMLSSSGSSPCVRRNGQMPGTLCMWKRSRLSSKFGSTTIFTVPTCTNCSRITENFEIKFKVVKNGNDTVFALIYLFETVII